MTSEISTDQTVHGLGKSDKKCDKSPTILKQNMSMVWNSFLYLTIVFIRPIAHYVLNVVRIS